MNEVHDVATGMEQFWLCSRRSFTRRLHYDSRLASDLAERLWSTPDSLIAGGTMIKDGDHTTVVRLSRENPEDEAVDFSTPPGVSRTFSRFCATNTLCFGGSAKTRELPREAEWRKTHNLDVSLSGGEAAYVLKRYNLRDGFHTFCHGLSTSRARRCWTYGRRLAADGIASPRPLAYLEQRWGPFKTRSFLLTDYVPGTLLRDFAVSADLTTDSLRSLAEQFAGIWRRMGELHLSHGDMKATNFVVDASGQIWLIDLDGMRRHWSTTWFHAARRRDWRRFMKNWSRSPETADAFRNALRRETLSRNRLWVSHVPTPA